MILIKNSPTHLLLSLTTYDRDISEDMMEECVGELVIILSQGLPPQNGKTRYWKVTKLQNRTANNAA